MTTEDNFQAKLDEHPEDWQTRLVFADWLQDRGDPRAAGYRELGTNRYFTFLVMDGVYAWFIGPHSDGGMERALPKRWALRLEGGKKGLFCGALLWVDYESRREADEAAALAFSGITEVVADATN